MSDKPLNSFFLYCKENRSILASSHPKLTNAEVTCLLGEYWRNMDHDTKNKYKRKAKKLREVSIYNDLSYKNLIFFRIMRNYTMMKKKIEKISLEIKPLCLRSISKLKLLQSLNQKSQKLKVNITNFIIILRICLKIETIRE